jgi:hypothetical protein
MVVAVALLGLVALAALIPAAQAPSSEQSSAASTDSQSGAGAAPVSEPAAPQMSEEEAIDAYGKLPLSCFFFSHKGPHSPSPRAKSVAMHWPSTS